MQRVIGYFNLEHVPFCGQVGRRSAHARDPDYFISIISDTLIFMRMTSFTLRNLLKFFKKFGMLSERN